WRRRRLALRLFRFLFAALQALAHPFTHVQACNTDHRVRAIRRVTCEPTGLAASNSLVTILPLGATRMRLMASQIPFAIRDQKYISLTTFRKTGVGVPTPVW